MSLDLRVERALGSPDLLVKYEGIIRVTAKILSLQRDHEIAAAFDAAGRGVGQATVRALLASPEAYALYTAAHEGAARGAWLKLRLEAEAL